MFHIIMTIVHRIYQGVLLLSHSNVLMLLKCYGTNNNYYVYKLCDLMCILFNYTPIFTVSINYIYIYMYMCRVADRFRVYRYLSPPASRVISGRLVGCYFALLASVS